jgi:hypothetical protein
MEMLPLVTRQQLVAERIGLVEREMTFEPVLTAV